jgi:hypothetical protein
VLGVGLLVGFRPTAGPIEWIAALGVITLIAFAISWLAVAMGMQAKSVHAVRRDHPRAVARHLSGLGPGTRNRVVGRERGRRLRVVDGDLRAEIGALSRGCPHSG